jgi:hypothetical protein
MTYQQFLLGVVCALVLIGCASPVSKDNTVGTPAPSPSEAPAKTLAIPPLPGFDSASR